MAKTDFSITREQALRHVAYNPETGEMWYLTGGFKRSAGDLVEKDRSVINILGSSYSKRKLIWFIQTGEWPTHKVNNIDIGDDGTTWESLRAGRVDKKSKITAERLRDLLDYDPLTGEFTWRSSTSSTGSRGEVAGCLKSSNGYVVIRVDRRLYTAHRLAVLHVTGEWPSDLVDHGDADRANNRWSNLRQATPSQNGQNKRAAQSNNRKSGLLGVYWSEQNQSWGAKVNLKGVAHHGGFHPTAEAAHQAYVELKRRLHPYGML